MTSYVDSNLSKGEEVVARAHVSWLSYLTPLIIAAFLFLIGLVAGGWILILIALLIVGKIALNIFTTELALTNKRIIAKFGFISRTTVELRLEKVESIGVDQGIMGRFLDYGSVVVKGTGGTETPVPAIKQPLEFRRVVNNYIEENDKA